MTIYSGQVSLGTDDGVQAVSSGNISLTGTSDELKNTIDTYWACRIQNVTIAASATVSAASLSVYAPSTNRTMDATLAGNKVANPGTLQTTTSYISGLAQTTHTVTWGSTTLTQNAFNASPDISAIITELIGQGSWASGNSMLFILTNAGSACFIEEYDGSPSEAAELSATYTAAAGNHNLLMLLGVGCGSYNGLGAGGGFFLNPIGCSIDRAQLAAIDRGSEPRYCATHEGGHVWYALLIGRGDLIDRVAVFPESPREVEGLGKLRAVTYYAEAIRDLPSALHARLTIAGLAATSLVYSSASGCGSDLSQLAGAGLIEHIPPLNHVENWRRWETPEISKLREPVEADLRGDLRWLGAFADRLCLARELSGETIRRAWAAYRSGVAIGAIFD